MKRSITSKNINTNNNISLSTQSEKLFEEKMKKLKGHKKDSSTPERFEEKEGYKYDRFWRRNQKIQTQSGDRPDRKSDFGRKPERPGGRFGGIDERA